MSLKPLLPAVLGAVLATVLPGALLVTLALAAAPPSYGREPGAEPNRIIDACIRAEGGSKRPAALRAVEYQGTLTRPDNKAAGTYTLIIER